MGAPTEKDQAGAGSGKIEALRRLNLIEGHEHKDKSNDYTKNRENSAMARKREPALHAQTLEGKRVMAMTRDRTQSRL